MHFHYIHVISALLEVLTYLRWDILGWLDPNCGIPLSRRKDSHLIKELIYPGE